MSPLTRRSLLSSAAAVAAPLVGIGNSPTRMLPSTGPSFSMSAGSSWAGPITNAVLNPVDAVRDASLEAADGRVGDRYVLRQVVQRAMDASLSSDYGDLSRSLPRLIGYAEALSLAASGREHDDVRRLLSDVYATAGWTLIKADNPAAAWVAAQRALHVAEQADDALRQAAATRLAAEVQMRARHYEDATRTAFLATVQLDAARPEERQIALCLRGAALLSAAAAAARRGDSREAYAALKAAAICADELGTDRAELGTVFGPTNVAIHRVAVAVELGNHTEALTHVPSVRLDRMPDELTERRGRFLIDVARAEAKAQNDNGAIGALLQAERIAPDELREHRLTHDLLRDLLLSERRNSEVRALVDRCNLLN